MSRLPEPRLIEVGETDTERRDGRAGLAAALRRTASEPDLVLRLGEGARRHVESAHDVRVLGAALGRIDTELAA